MARAGELRTFLEIAMSEVSTSATGVRRRDGGIRPFEPDDFEAFRALFGDVWGWDPCREWFEWRYGSPYLDHVPMIVAERDGQLAGAIPSIAYRLRSNAGTQLALQPTDAMVHPDYRREGLFARMAEAAIERYRAGRPACFFNFPNDRILSAFLDLGWHEVGTVATYYRVQSPSGLPGSAANGGVAGRVATALAGGYLRYRDGRATTDDRVPVERRATVPASLLAELYRRAVPNRLHVERDRAYYRWRFANPNWESRAYVAGGEEPEAALVACRLERHGATYVRLMETAPLSSLTPDVGAALLDAVVSDHADADVLAVAGDTLQHDVLANRGFHRDDRLPLSLVTSGNRLVVRPLPDGAATTRASQPTDRSRWLATFGEQDGIC